MRYDSLIVGAGLAGCVLAERLARDAGQRVLLIDRRDHIAGNASDFRNEEGLLVQRYGAHVFHTSAKAVWDYLSRFTAWNGYVHRVLEGSAGGLQVCAVVAGIRAAGRHVAQVSLGVGDRRRASRDQQGQR